MGIGEKNFSLPIANFFHLSSFICFYFQLFSRVLCEILNLGRLGSYPNEFARVCNLGALPASDMDASSISNSGIHYTPVDSIATSICKRP